MIYFSPFSLGVIFSAGVSCREEITAAEGVGFVELFI